MAQVRKDGETWTLVLVKHLRHPPEKVWRALTEPAHLREWAPFDASGDLGNAGTVTVTWVGSTAPMETRITRADAPKLLEYNSGGNDLRWELEGRDGGTRLTLWPLSIAASSQWVLPDGTLRSTFWSDCSTERPSAASPAQTRCSSLVGSGSTSSTRSSSKGNKKRERLLWSLQVLLALHTAVGAVWSGPIPRRPCRP